MVNSSQGEFYIIDHGNTMVAGNPASSIALAATTAGDFLYRFGDPARYGSGTSPSVSSNWENATAGTKQIGGSSNVQWIPAGMPGAGHLLVFDNNQYLFERSPQSFVFEINPYLNSSGTTTTSYVDPPSAGYTTLTFDQNTQNANQQLSNQVVWKYASLGSTTLFSQWGSSAQRLPNGDTLICSTVNGYMVEVNSSGNVVWEYINPVTNSGIVTAIGDCLPMTNAVPRAIRYAANFAGFTGHTLTPGTTITGTAYPLITGTALTPAAPISTSTPWVTSTITAAAGLASAKLTYSAGSGSGTQTTPFTETFGTTAVKPWTGSTGSDNTWTISGSPNPFELRTGANYTTSTTACGVEYKCSVVTTASMATSSSVNAAGTSGNVTFYVQGLSLSTSDGWAFQLSPDGGTTWNTRLSETGTSHVFQQFTYTLASTELVSTLKMRFVITGGGSSDTGRIDLDQIVLTLTSGGAVSNTVTMYDDGAHGDGAAGDGVYGAQIAAMAAGTTVSYYVTATDKNGLVTYDPPAAPTVSDTYTVQSAAAPVITGLSVSSGSIAGGTSVTLTGTNLGSATAVKFGSTAATIVSNTSTQIVATSPAAGAGTVDVTVTTANGTSPVVPADQFTYPKAVPTVSATDAGGVYSGSTYPATATVTGVGGTAASSLEGVGLLVMYYAGSTASGSGSLTAPSAVGTYTAVAMFAGSTDYTAANSSRTFTIAGALPTVSGISLNSGSVAGGTSVTITGTNLSSATAVKFGSTPATIVGNTATQVTVLSPAGTVGTVDITVTTTSGTLTISSADQFTYTQATPTVNVTDSGGVYTGSTYPATATVTGLSGTAAASLEGVSPTFTYCVGSTPSGNGSLTAPSTAGTYTVVATFAGSTNYTSASASTTFIITQATPTVQVTDAGGAYTGSTYPATATVTGVSGTASSLEGVTPTLLYYVGSTPSGNGSFDRAQRHRHLYRLGHVRRKHRLHLSQRLGNVHDQSGRADDQRRQSELGLRGGRHLGDHHRNQPGGRYSRQFRQHASHDR